jgi:hypothetical protein
LSASSPRPAFSRERVCAASIESLTVFCLVCSGFYYGFTRPKTARAWCRTKLTAEEIAEEQAAAGIVAPIVPQQVAPVAAPVAVGEAVYDGSTLQAIPVAVASHERLIGAQDTLFRRFARGVTVACAPFGVAGVLTGLLFGMYISALVGVCEDEATVGKWAFASESFFHL